MNLWPHIYYPNLLLLPTSSDFEQTWFNFNVCFRNYKNQIIKIWKKIGFLWAPLKLSHAFPRRKSKEPNYVFTIAILTKSTHFVQKNEPGFGLLTVFSFVPFFSFLSFLFSFSLLIAMFVYFEIPQQFWPEKRRWNSTTIY